MVNDGFDPHVVQFEAAAVTDSLSESPTDWPCQSLLGHRCEPRLAGVLRWGKVSVGGACVLHDTVETRDRQDPFRITG